MTRSPARDKIVLLTSLVLLTISAYCLGIGLALSGQRAWGMWFLGLGVGANLGVAASAFAGLHR